MKKIHIVNAAWCVALFFSCCITWARASVEQIEIQKETSVFSSTRVVEPAFVLSPGDRVLVSTKNINGFYRIKKVGDFKKRGYVRIEDLSFSGLTQAPKSIRKPPMFTPKPKKEVGALFFGLGASGSFQSESELDAGEGQIFTVSSFSAFGYGAKFAWDRPFSGEWKIRFFLNYRLLEMKGDAGLEVDGAPTDNVVREQSFLGFGILFRRGFSENSPWWWGVSGEIAKLRKSVTTIAEAEPVESDVSGAPLRYFVLGHLGYDVPTSSSWGVIPELGVGAIANTKPITFFAEASLNFAFSF